jgi:hypothetical protein
VRRFFDKEFKGLPRGSSYCSYVGNWRLLFCLEVLDFAVIFNLG